MPTLRAWLPRAALAALPLLASCSEAYWTGNVHASRRFPSNSVIVTNADIRTINRIEGFERSRRVVRDENGQAILRETADGKRHVEQEIVMTPRQFVCAEPSPDVARVVQAALSAGATGNFDVSSPVPGGLSGADAIKAAGSARLDAARSEALAQLTRRIATIQLLRDGMYRACEAFANGAIGQEIYTAIVSRYDKIMVTMLLGEMATGNLPGLATAGGSATAGQSGATLAALTEKLIEARQAQTSAETKLKATNEDAAAKEGEVGKKEAQLKEAKESDTASARAALDKAIAERDAAKKAQGIDKAAAEKAKEDVMAVERAMAIASGQAGAASQAAIRGSTVAGASSEIAEILYKMQREYLNDPQVGTQVLICTAEAAQPDPMGTYQKEFCDKIFATVFRGADTPNTERAREVQLAELRNQGIARIMATLPATATDAHRREALAAARALFPPPPAVPQTRR